MATGTTTDYNVTRTELIDLALSALGVSEPQNDDYTLSVRVLNLLTRHLDAKATWLHAIDNTESTLTLTAGTNEYSYVDGSGADEIQPNILKLEWAAYLNSANDREPLVILDKLTALRTPLKDDSNSQPIAVYLEKGRLTTENNMIVFPTPNSAYTIVYSYRKPLYDFDLATDNPDVPQHFVLPLQKLLTYELSYHYGTPLSERQLLKQEAEIAFKASENLEMDEPSYLPLKAEYY